MGFMKLLVVAGLTGLLGVILGMSLGGSSSTSSKHAATPFVAEAVADPESETLAKSPPAYAGQPSVGDLDHREGSSLRPDPAAGVPPRSVTKITARGPASRSSQSRAERAVSAQIDAMVAQARNEDADSETSDIDPTTHTQEVDADHARRLVSGMIHGFEEGLAESDEPEPGPDVASQPGGRHD